MLDLVQDIPTHRYFLHFFFETLGFLVAFRYYIYLRKRQEDAISTQHRYLIIVGATLGAFLGSRLLGSFEDPSVVLSGKAGLVYFSTSKTIVGGLLGGLWAVELTKKLIAERQRSGDLFTYPIITGMILGRIGCLFMGIYEPTYGLPSELPWAMDLGDGIGRHPVAAYEILFLLLLWLGLKRSEDKLRSGARFKLFMMAYLCFRFFVEWLKPGVFWAAGLSSIQLACLGGLAYYADVIFQPRKKLLSNYG